MFLKNLTQLLQREGEDLIWKSQMLTATVTIDGVVNIVNNAGVFEEFCKLQ